jgi:hypothetical protein
MYHVDIYSTFFARPAAPDRERTASAGFPAEERRSVPGFQRLEKTGARLPMIGIFGADAGIIEMVKCASRMKV